ncbi:MAG: exosortase E/protease, VPEID-CTERM system [Rhodobacteraceae bacterium]|nr:exosortase E/protease, VPEID-CTERM system [Paracoccaceae bacterium]
MSDRIVQSDPGPHMPAFSASRFGLLALLILVELAALALAYQFMADIECTATGAYGACRLLRSMVARALVVMAIAGLLAWARPNARHIVMTALSGGQTRWLAVHFIGVAIMFLPLLLYPGPALAASFGQVSALWLLGTALTLTGLALWLTGPAGWRKAARTLGPAGFAILLGAALVPDIVQLSQPLWDIQALTGLTLFGVTGLLFQIDQTAFLDIPQAIVGLDGFSVRIASQCSGIEGAALIAIFGSLYAGLFWRDIRPGRFFLVVMPLAIFASWVLNIIRITMLVLIGARISPELAINGFHSHAGWLFFCLIALAIIWVIQTLPWLHRTKRAAHSLPKLRDDPSAALILPFAVFMASGMIASAFWPHPDIGYPFRMALMLAVLWPFRRQYWQMIRGVDPLSLSAGLLIGLAWAYMARGPSDAGMALAGALSGMSAAGFIFWVFCRLIGTSFIVPLIEELFFRGFILARIDQAGQNRAPTWHATALRLFAVVFSTVLFAALHGRWLAAALAGLIFALLYLRRGKVWHAVQAHMAANLTIGIWALAAGDFSLI